MYTFDVEYTATMNELKTMKTTNLERQEQLSERICHLESSVIEQRVEETEVGEKSTTAMSKLTELKDRWRTLSSVYDYEQHWIEAMGAVSEWVWHTNSFLSHICTEVQQSVLRAGHCRPVHVLGCSHQYLGHYGRCG